VQAVCDFVHSHMTFGYEHSRSTRTASEAYMERHGVCRDYPGLCTKDEIYVTAVARSERFT
jgi:transglutaminase-like putative cysteine protease